MKKSEKISSRIKKVLLVLSGVAVGALVFSNMEYSVSFNGTTFSNTPSFATATSNIADAPISSLRNFNEAFVQIAESATPSVVTIFTEKTVNQRVVSPFNFFGSPFDDFFGRPDGNSAERKNVRRGIGSGVIVTADGYILTNNHVIDGADVVYVRTADKRRLDAKVIGTDPKTDIAVIKVNQQGLKPIVIGDSDKLRVGEWVIAIGSPLGENLARTVTQGIVSAKGRANVGLADYEDFIQTDAAINPGNSGGALVNINGELVGINTAIASRTGGFEGIGFAVPSNMAKSVLTALITTGKVTRSYLGVSIQDIDDNIAKAMNVKAGEGALVGTVMENSPAARAGMQTGDVILEFNGAKVTSSAALRNAIATQTPGSMVYIRVLRDGALKSFAARLEEQTPKTASSTTPAKKADINSALGFRAEELTPELAQRLKLKGSSGKVVITAIQQQSTAYRAGLRPGDVILSVNKQAVSSVASYNALVKNLAKGELLLLLIERGGNKSYIAFTL
uniref:Peptidase S1C, Do n=1 Tax=Chlorobium chlorochromatii (strain CaD3) TaxID=340177 RepID=Q3ATA8_CHLCH